MTTPTWRLDITATHFVFTDVCVTTAEPLPVGHAHVLSGGSKIGSAYVPVFDLGARAPGRHRITVILRGQDHRALVAGRDLIKTELIITIPEPATAS